MVRARVLVTIAQSRDLATVAYRIEPEWQTIDTTPRDSYLLLTLSINWILCRRSYSLIQFSLQLDAIAILRRDSVGFTRVVVSSVILNRQMPKVSTIYVQARATHYLFSSNPAPFAACRHLTTSTLMTVAFSLMTRQRKILFTTADYKWQISTIFLWLQKVSFLLVNPRLKKLW